MAENLEQFPHSEETPTSPKNMKLNRIAKIAAAMIGGTALGALGCEPPTSREFLKTCEGETVKQGPKLDVSASAWHGDVTLRVKTDFDENCQAPVKVEVFATFQDQVTGNRQEVKVGEKEMEKPGVEDFPLHFPPQAGCMDKVRARSTDRNGKTTEAERDTGC